MNFQGATYEPALDGERLGKQLKHVRQVMLESYPAWLTLGGIQYRCKRGLGFHHSEASISARLRELRSMGYTVERKRMGDGGLWTYRVLPKPVREAKQLELIRAS